MKIGDVLAGKYRVERVIGAGGMGMVVAARHVDLDQQVAIKLMLREVDDPQQAERFMREARLAVQLKSAHAAKVLDVGKLKNGEPFMVMELLSGHDLDDVVHKGGPQPPHVAVEYVLQACEAFAEAHGLGMIHRDIKLKNLFLTRTIDGRPQVKVLDFGLAKTMGQDVSLTATTAVFGSPQYMSPEQMRAARDVDTRSDIWSIGVCLYELLTTRVPFDAPSLPEICAMVLKDPVVPPSRWAQGIPPDLEAVVLRCLEKDPARRFQTVGELAVALEPYGGQEGSAKRILHVMSAAESERIGLDGPTLQQRSSRIPPSDTVVREEPNGGKTLAAWGSGGLRSSGRGAPLVLVAATFGILAAIGMAAGGYALLTRKPPPKSLVETAAEPPSAATSDTPVPAATGTAPSPADTSAPAATVQPAPITSASPAATLLAAGGASKPTTPKPAVHPTAPKPSAKPAASTSPLSKF